MKKLFFIFILITINIVANMDDSPQMMTRHHHKPYMKKFHEDKNLSPDQKNEIMLLRMDFMNEARSVDTGLKKIRKDMNHCMRSNKDDKDREYEMLKKEREQLRKEKHELIKKYKDAVDEILKKQ